MILAKSDGTSLQEHISACLQIWSELKKALPLLPIVTRQNKFFELLFASIYIHDFGKAQIEFQKVLQKKTNVWQQQRHELYSVPFAEKFNLSKVDQECVKRTVLAHHRDFKTLFETKYRATEDLEFETDIKWRALGRDHPEDFLKNIQRHFQLNDLKMVIQEFDACADRWGIGDLKFNQTVVFSKQKHPYEEFTANRTRLSIDSKMFMQNLLLAGAMKICDHYGSAGVRHIQRLESQHFQFLEKLKTKLTQSNQSFYGHQTRSFAIQGNGLLIAPTGAGKTEAALGWLQKQLQLQEGRTFYVLPYTASINAMHQRLMREMDPDSINDDGSGFSQIVGLQHGNLPFYLLEYLEFPDDTDSAEKNAEIRKVKEILRRMQHPLKIVTPFQLLKYFYGVKGFDMGITQLAGAKLIFDEIHAYDPETFAQIVVMLHFLITRLNCSVFIMTATLPTFMRNIVKQILNIQRPVTADVDFLLQKKRHQINILEKDVFACLPSIREYLKERKRVIVICNTVKQAQEVYLKLVNSGQIEPEKIALLHGRFNAKDRLDNEKKAMSPDTQLLIGTQAIEISLDIDYDVMFTEPAPLDALLQRFGRVNRNGLNPPCPIYVLRQGGEHDHYIYPKLLVQKSLDVLSTVDVLAESQVTELLDAVYPDWLPEEKVKYENTLTFFQKSLEALQPYSESKEREAEFYEQFTGIQVLPAKFFSDYQNYLQTHNFIEAARLLVNIQRGMYFRLRYNEVQSQIERRTVYVEKKDGRTLPQVVLVAKCQYDHCLGMTLEFEDIQDFDNRSF